MFANEIRYRTPPKKRKPNKRSLFQKDDVSSAPSPQRSLRYTCDQIYDTVVSYDWIRDGPAGDGPDEWRSIRFQMRLIHEKLMLWPENAPEDVQYCTCHLSWKSNCAHPPVWSNTIGPSFFEFAFNNPDDQLFLDWTGYAPFGPCPQNNPSVVFYCLFFFCYFAQFPLPLPLPGRFAGRWKWKQSVSHNTVVTSHSYQILTCELI